MSFCVWCSNFILLHVSIHFPSTSYWSDSLFSIVYFCLLCYSLVDHRCMDLSLDFLSGSSESIFLFFVPVPYCFDNCSFVVCSEVSLSFLKIALEKKKIAWLFRVFKTERKKKCMLWLLRFMARMNFSFVKLWRRKKIFMLVLLLSHLKLQIYGHRAW